MADKVLEILVPCGEEEMERGNFELALDHFSEVLELVYFRFLPGVLLMKAKCLLRLVRKKRGFSSPVNSKNILKWYYYEKSPYLFFLHFESMIYKYLPCQILGHDFDEKSDFLNYEFSKRLPAITQFKNGCFRKRVGSREDVT